MKKNNCFLEEWKISGLQKLLKVMKLTSFLILISVISVFANKTYSQTKVLNLNMKNSTVKEVLRNIEDQSEFYFMYSDKLVDVNRKVSVEIKNSKVDEVLDQLFASTNVEHTVKDRFILLTTPDVSGSDLRAIQQKTISGTVTDEAGQPLPGVTVLIKGTTTGTVTNMDGNYSISNISEGATLVFSFVGMRTQEVIITNQSSINLTMLVDAFGIEEVVTIGYGTKKKINLTGSVSTMNKKELVNRSLPSTERLLQGAINGLEVNSATGQPGRENNALTLRGRGSFETNNSPLVIIDGMEGDLSTISANDIESISALKDAASASIYGSRAANGVLIVTTKKGEIGKNTISYNAYVGVQNSAVNIDNDIWNSYQYMTMYNEYCDRVGLNSKYPDKVVNLYKDPNRNKDLYPDYNTMDALKSAMITNHNIVASGGNNNAVYNISLGYTDQNSLFRNNNYKKYTLNTNLELTINDWLKVGSKGNIFYGDLQESRWEEQQLFVFLGHTPMSKEYLPDGSGRYAYSSMPTGISGEWQNRNVMAMTADDGPRQNTKRTQINQQIYTKVVFLDNQKMKLNWLSKLGVVSNDEFTKMISPANMMGYYYLKESDYIDGGDDEHKIGTKGFFASPTGVYDTYRRGMRIVLFTTLDYEWSINKDNLLNAMMGYQEESEQARYNRGSKNYFPNDVITELDGGSSEGQNARGRIETDYAMRSLFGRLNYSYKSKYLLEANFRYDGTSRMSPENRWGLFHSYSGAWRVSEESFIKNNTSWIDNLKFRASWGVLGNSAIGDNDYAWQTTYSTTSLILNNEVVQGIVANDMANRNLEWETTTVTNFGVDLSIFNSLFGLSLDAYTKDTEGILAEAMAPFSLGVSPPKVNYGSMRNSGIEFEVVHRNKIGDFVYTLSFMGAHNKNEVTKLMAPSFGDYTRQEGIPYDSHYLWIADGIFHSQKEIDDAPKQQYTPLPGDLRYKDLNNDGVINDEDRDVVKGVYPDLNYSFRLTGEYKSFDLIASFYGVSGRKIYHNNLGVYPFYEGTPPQKKYLDAWSPSNPDSDIPAVFKGDYLPMTGQRSTYFLEDCSFLRLKLLQLGYTLPNSVISKIGIGNLRVYLSGENLLTFTPLTAFEPENLSNDLWHYPQMRTISFGLNLKF